MKKLSLLLLCTLVSLSASAQAYRQATSATHYFHEHYAGTNSSNIPNTTLTAEKFSGVLARPNGTVVSVTCSTTGDRRLQNNGLGQYGITLLPSDLTLSGIYGMVILASDCIPRDFRFDVIPAIQYDTGHAADLDLAGRIASTTAAITASQVAIQGTQMNLSVEDRRRIAVAGNVIPASGMTLPTFSIERSSRAADLTLSATYLVARGLSYSTETPTALFWLVANDSGSTAFYNELSFSHSYSAMSGTDITGATPYYHQFYMSIPATLPNGVYQLVMAVEKDSAMVGGVATFVLSPTVEINSTAMASQSTLTEFISDTSESFRAIRSGDPADYTIYRTSTGLDRAVAGVSSATSRYATAGEIYGFHTIFWCPYNEEYVVTDKTTDNDENYPAKSGRSKVFDAAVTSVTQTAISEGQTLTTAGDLD